MIRRGRHRSASSRNRDADRLLARDLNPEAAGREVGDDRVDVVRVLGREADGDVLHGWFSCQVQIRLTSSRACAPIAVV